MKGDGFINPSPSPWAVSYLPGRVNTGLSAPDKDQPKRLKVKTGPGQKRLVPDPAEPEPGR